MHVTRTEFVQIATAGIHTAFGKNRMLLNSEMFYVLEEQAPIAGKGVYRAVDLPHQP